MTTWRALPGIGGWSDGEEQQCLRKQSGGESDQDLEAVIPDSQEDSSSELSGEADDMDNDRSPRLHIQFVHVDI